MLTSRTKVLLWATAGGLVAIVLAVPLVTCEGVLSLHGARDAGLRDFSLGVETRWDRGSQDLLRDARRDTVSQDHARLDAARPLAPQKPRNLTAGEDGDDQNPLWSSDSQTLAFSTHRAHGNFDIWRMTREGQNAKAITDLPKHDAVNLPGAAWCAATGKLVYSADTSGKENLWTINADGTGAKEIYASANLDREPTWSPTCDRVAFQSSRNGNWDIYVVDANGGHLTRLTTHGASDWAPNWSPVGEDIVFQSKRSGRWKLWTIRADGSALKQRTQGSSEDTDCSFGPKGRYVVYSTDGFGAKAHIAILALMPGAKAKQITTGSAYDGAPAWSPDGLRIAFESDRAGNLDVWVVDLYAP